MGILNIFGAFKAGKEIINPTLWKNVGNLANSITIVLSTSIGFYRLFIGPLPITDEQTIAFSSAIATALLIFNNVIATITTKKDVSVTGITMASTPDDKK